MSLVRSADHQHPVCDECAREIDTSTPFGVRGDGRTVHLSCIDSRELCPDCVKAAGLGKEHKH